MADNSGTIGDFSTQWKAFDRNDGYFGDEAILEDYLEPLLSLESLRGRRVAEIGCGNGRFLKMMSRYASEVVGIEPGDGWENARKYNADFDNVEVINASVYELPEIEPLDHALSLGVIHHLPDPPRAVEIMRDLVKPGGRVTIWVYGYEGNELYLQTFGRARKITQRLPHPVLDGVSAALTPGLALYIRACRRLPLPMSDYMTGVLGKLSLYHLKVNIYDQLNPRIAHYWKEHEVRELMESAGLDDVRLHHRHGYSWTATGVVPSGAR